MTRHHKYGAVRTVARDRSYPSKAEAEYAEILFGLKEAGHIIEIIEQPRTELGVPENIYRPDFFVVWTNGDLSFIDVKGKETAKFRKDKKLWQKYGRLPLQIVRKKGKKFVVDETVDPRPMEPKR